MCLSTLWSCVCEGCGNEWASVEAVRLDGVATVMIERGVLR